jgi:hypothetical protein
MPAAKKRPAARKTGAKGKPADRVVNVTPRAEPLKPQRIEPLNAKGECQDKLDALGLQGLCALILEGHSVTRIAGQLGISKGAMLNWIAADPDRSARVKEAREQSAEADADRAENVLMEATTAVEVARARELAAHYRWKAKTSNPKRYGDKLEVDSTLKVNELSDGDLDKQISRLAAAIGPAAVAALTGGAGSASADGPVTGG